MPVGYISSAGYAHHVGKSMAMGYIETSSVVPGTLLDAEMLGEFFTAEMQGLLFMILMAFEYADE